MNYRDEFDYGQILLDLGISEEGSSTRVPASRQRELFGYVPFGKQMVRSYFVPGIGYRFNVSKSVCFGLDSVDLELSPKELFEALVSHKSLKV